METDFERLDPQPHFVWSGSWEPGTVEPLRILSDHELVMVSQGSCSVELEAARFELDAGSFLVVPPGVRHATFGGPSGVTRFCVHFDWAPGHPPVKGLLWAFLPADAGIPVRKAPEGFPQGAVSGRFPLESQALGLMESLLALSQRGDPLSRLLCRPRLHELLLALLLGAPQEGKQPAGASRRLAYELRETLDGSIGGMRPLHELLARKGYAYEHLCRVFTAAFGLSPSAYLMAVRVEKAKAMLRSPEFRSVSEVAYALGFEDRGYFSRAFRSRVGMTPLEYAGSVRSGLSTLSPPPRGP